MMKKDVMLIVNYWHFEQEKASSRYRTFANILCEKYDLEVVTSTFCHLTKKQREVQTLSLDKLPYKMTLQYEKGYKKNIGFDRISSYKQFGKNVKKYLETRKKPDLIIVSVPSLRVADEVTKYANKNNIPVIVDIQDLWPEAFKMALSIPIISDILFYPMKKQADRIYSRADKIMAVSDTYVVRGLKCNKKDSKGLSIYIGSDSELIKQKTANIEIDKPNNEFWIGYVGALGHSYDIESVIKAIKILNNEGIENIKFLVMGEGVLKEHFKQVAIENEVNVDFTGLLEYGTMMKTLMACDVAVNPIIGKSVSSIINKVADYSAAGVPVINTQNSLEYRKLLEDNNAGLSVENGNIFALAEAIKALYTDDLLRKTMSENSTKMYDKYFDRQKSYPRLIDEIEKLLENEKE
ncbi:MAG: glycosyltransferase family 4 protein [Clostridiales bacterium]|nr:glycosyltransferase family 4 protein [Clostridiales bacterium]